ENYDPKTVNGHNDALEHSDFWKLASYQRQQQRGIIHQSNQSTNSHLSRTYTRPLPPPSSILRQLTPPMEPLPNENKENHLQQRLKDAARKNVVFSPNRLGPTATVPSSSQKSSFQPKSILKTPSKVMPFSLFASPTREDRSEDSAEEDDFVVTAVGALRRDEVNDRIDAYQMLHTKFRVCDETPYLATVEENIETFVEAFKRDIAQTECNGLTHATLRCLGFFLFQPSIVPMFPAAAILDLLTLLVSKIHETQDKVTCNLAVWCIAIQRMPAKIVAPLTPRLVDALVYAMRSPFKSVTIQNESLAALDVLFKQTPTAVGLQAPTWLPPVLEYLTHPISGLRSKALHVLTGSLPRVVEEQERIEDLIGEFLENRSTKFAKDLEELLTSHEEKYVIYVWGAVVALLGRKLHRSLALNHLLKKCFNTRKNEVKVSAYAAWTRLIYNFSLNNHLLHEKRIKLIKTPLDNCFLNEKAVAVKMAGTRAWMALIFACGDGLTKCFEPVITTVMRLVLTDECDEVRVTGFGILSSLFSGDVPSESLNPPPYSRIPAPYGDTKILLRDENLEPADIHRLDPKWVRANVSVFLELLLLGLRSQVRVEPVTAAESATVGNNQEEKEAWCKGDVTGRPIVTKLFMDTWTDLMRVLQLVNQKEINPSPEGIMSLHECLRFVAKVAAMDGDDLAPSSIARTAYGDWTAKMEIVKLLTDSLITYYTSRVLVSSKYRMVEEEERWGVVEGARKVVVTPLVFLIRQWLDMPSIFVGTDFEHVYWTMITPFVGMVGGAMDALLAVLGVLVARKGERTEQDRTFRAKWWKFM
ncbi:Rap1-interacting factor 1 N terminal-domain-containing protein, partial [Jimgerdemannia flammicorona]